eukprot:4040069-Prymnesium_polylepis.1
MKPATMKPTNTRAMDANAIVRHLLGSRLCAMLERADGGLGAPTPRARGSGVLGVLGIPLQLGGVRGNRDEGSLPKPPF